MRGTLRFAKKRLRTFMFCISFAYVFESGSKLHFLFSPERPNSHLNLPPGVLLDSFCYCCYYFCYYHYYYYYFYYCRHDK